MPRINSVKVSLRAMAFLSMAVFFLLGVTPAFAAKDFNIRNAGTYHFTVKGASGNIGIGSASPAQKLDVQGTVIVSGNVGIGTLTPQAALAVMNGNVGIGTLSTLSPLTVTTWKSGAQATLLTLVNLSSQAGATADIEFAPSATPTVTGRIGASRVTGGGLTDLTFSTSNAAAVTEKMRLTGGGNLGIGTTVPSSKLSVAGGIGIGTGVNSPFVSTAAPVGGLIVQDNVGIGSLTPGVPLDVQGTARMTAFTLSTGAAAGYVLQTNSVGIGTWVDAATLATSGGGWTASGTNVYTTTGSNNVGLGTTTPQGGLVVTNGNLGIGTWAPNEALTVTGSYIKQGNSANSGGGLVLNTGASSAQITQIFLRDRGTDKWVIRKNALNDFDIIDSANSNAAALYIKTGGNIGIGSVAPAQTLDVQGSVHVTGNVGIGTLDPQAAFIVTNGNVGIGTWAPPAGYLFFVSGSIGSNSGAQATYFRDWNNGAYYIDPSGGAFSPGVSAVIAGNVGIGTVSPANQFVVNGGVGIGTGQNSSFINTLAPSGGLIVQGNVGIGSVTPGTPLDVQGTARMTAFTLSTGAAAGYVLQTNSVGVGTWVDAATLAGGASGWTASGTNVYTTTGSNNVGLGTTTPQGGFVVTNGNVGIGTWAPRVALDVQGTLAVTSIAGNVGIGTTTPQGGLVVTNGNVGIGTWAPGSSILAVSGDVAALVTLTRAAVQNANIRYKNSTYAYYAGLSPGGNFGIGTNSNLDLSPAFVSTQTGNVGLGTTSPQAGLVSMNNVGIGTWTADGGRLIIQGGNVGIGTVSPGTALDVQGTVRSVGLTMTTGAAAGYVLQTNSVGVGTWVAPGTISAGADTPGGSGTELQYRGGAATLGAVSGSGVDVNGNVGIGSSGPGQKLDVQGSVRVSGNVGIGTLDPQAAFVVTNGNVGIGTWAPAALLQLGGTSAASVGGRPTYPGLLFIPPTNTSNPLVPVASGIEFSATASATGYGIRLVNPDLLNNNTPLLIQSRLSSASWTNIMAIGSGGGGVNVGIGTFMAQGQLDVEAVSSPIVFNATAGTKNVGVGTTTPQASFVVTNGNVGIGTWAPTKSFQVGGGSTWNVNMDTASDTTMTVNYSTDSRIVFSTNANNSFGGGSGYATATGAGAIRLGQNGQGYSYLVGNGANLLLNPVSGNVGIGTITPQAGFVSMNNVGIGTWTADGRLIVQGGNVGVGTVTPGTPLDIQGTARMTGLTLSTGAAAGYVLQTNSVGVGTWVAPGTISAGADTPGGSGTELQYRGGAATLGAVSGSGVDVNGNVGIGSSGPGQKLDVNGSVRITGNVGIGTLDPQGGLVVTNGNVGIGTWETSAGKLIVQGGNVGIGTSLPEASLAVNGFLALDGSDSVASVPKTVNFKLGWKLGLYSNTFAIGIPASTMAFRVPSTNYVSIFGTTLPAGNATNLPTGVPDTTAVVSFGGDGSARFKGNVGIGTVIMSNQLAVNGAVGIGTLSSSYLTTIAPPGGMIVEGNVGLGSLSPGTPLDIQGTARMTAFTLSTGAAAGYVLQSNSVGVGTWVDAATLAGGSSGWSASGTNVYTTTGSNNVGIGTTTPQGGLVVTNGNIGLGTWVPGSLLTLSGGATSDQIRLGQDAANYYKIGRNTTTGNLDFNGTQTGFTGYTFSGGNVGIGTVTPGGKLAIMDGNIGIGTWVPTRALVVVSPGTSGDQVSAVFQNWNSGLAMSSIMLVNTQSAAYGSNGAVEFTAIRQSDGSADLHILSGPGGGVGVNSKLYIAGSSGNVGIGTVVPQSKLVVAGGGIGIGTSSTGTFIRTAAPDGGLVVEGNAGIGTWTADGGRLIVKGGNVGIGSAWPGTPLDVQGTARMTNFILSNSPSAGYVLQTNSVGVGTWVDAATLAGGASGWTASGANVYTTTGSNNVGIGTTTPQGGFVVTNGNVGIGTWAPLALLDLDHGNPTQDKLIWVDKQSYRAKLTKSAGNIGLIQLEGSNSMFGFQTRNTYNSGTFQNTLIMTTPGNVGVGTIDPQGAFVVVGGNVGIGSVSPIQPLDIQGTARMTNFILSNSPSAGYVLQTNSVGVGTWVDAATLAGSGSGWTAGSGNVYTTTGSNNVGIGTTTPQGGFVVTNGNVGIGTWAPRANLDVQGTFSFAYFGGNVGIGTTAQQGAFVVTNGNVGMGTWAPRFPLEVNGSISMGPTQNNNYLIFNDVGTSNREYIAEFDNGLAGLNANGVFIFGSDSALSNTPTSPTAGISVSGIYSLANVGIGTWTPSSSFVVAGGGVGIGTSGSSFVTTRAPNGGMLIEGNVGIGSVTPGTPLDIQGTARMTAFTLSTGAAAGYVLQTNSVGVGTWVDAATLAGGASGWTASGTNVYTTTGSNNVGIGTTTPQGGLVVTNGNVGIGTWETSRNLLNVAGGMGVGTTYVANYIAPPNGLMVQGNVGIGTYNPTAALQVKGGGNVAMALSAPNGAMSLGVANGSGAFVNYAGQGDTVLKASSGSLILNPVSNDVYVANNTTEFFRVNSGGNVGVGSWGSNTTNLRNRLDVAGNIGIGTNTSSSYVNTAAPLGGMIVEGNVGIGSVTPGTPLDIQGTARMTAFTLSGNGAAAGNVMVASSTTGIGSWMAASTLPVSATAGGSATQLQYNTGSLFGGVSGSGVDVNGNVGIGSSGPGQKLDVQGSVRVSGNVGIGTLDPQAALVVTNGNVGIGTWAPNFLLDLGRSQSNTKLAVYETSTTNFYGFGTNTYGGGSLTFSAGTNGTPQMVLGFGGNLGLGTTVPYNKLSVAGGVGIGTGVNTAYVGTAGPVGGLIVEGNVGLGSLSPGTPLDVQGTARMTAFTLSTGAAAGYVLQTNSVGMGTWVSPASLATNTNDWTLSGANVYLTTGSNNVGIGTSTPQGGLVVTNGNVGIGTWAPVSSMDIHGSLGVMTVTKSSNYTATASDYVILVDASSGAVTITLPSAVANPGRTYVIKKTDSSGNAVVVSGAQNIDSSSSVNITAQYQSYTVVSNGSQWWII